MNKQLKLKLASMLMMMCAGNAMAPDVDSTAVRPAGTSVMNSVRPVIICHRLQSSSPIQVSDEFLQQSLDSVDGIRNGFWYEVSVPCFKASSALLHHLNSDRSDSYTVDQDGAPLTAQDLHIMRRIETMSPLIYQGKTCIMNIDKKLTSFENNLKMQADYTRDMIREIYMQQNNKDAIRIILSQFKKHSGIQQQMIDILSELQTLSQYKNEFTALCKQEEQRREDLSKAKQKVDEVMHKYFDDLKEDAEKILNVLENMRDKNDKASKIFSKEYIEVIDTLLNVLMSYCYLSLKNQSTPGALQDIEHTLKCMDKTYSCTRNRMIKHLSQIESLLQKEYSDNDSETLVRDAQRFAENIEISLTLSKPKQDILSQDTFVAQHAMQAYQSMKKLQKTLASVAAGNRRA